MDKSPARPAKSGRTPRENTNGDKYAFMHQSKKSTEPLALDQVDPQTLAQAVNAVIENGDLISFTRTSDGGAICITVIAQMKRHKVYASNLQELTDLLEALAC